MTRSHTWAQQLAARLRLFNSQLLGSLFSRFVWPLLVLFRACLQLLTILKGYANNGKGKEYNRSKLATKAQA